VTAIFITGTGTDVGKTFITAALIRHFGRQGMAVSALKPVVTGFDPERAAASDPGVLLAALGRSTDAEELDRVSPWRFAAPLSPDLAARRENRQLDYRALVDFSSRTIAAHRGVLFIEGIGGIMVPLDDRHTVLDWMTMLRVPLLLVAGSYVGTISHTLTALHVLARRNLDVAAIAISESAGSAAPLDDTVATIARFADAIEVVGVPRLPPATEHPAFERLAELLG
jgi:dethiobiotin synthetase